MSNNSLLLKTLLKSVMPTVQKLVESGKIDRFLQDLKARYAEGREMAEADSVEILVTTEADGVEYANVVVLNSDLKVTEVLAQEKLTTLLTSLLNQSEL